MQVFHFLRIYFIQVCLPVSWTGTLCTFFDGYIIGFVILQTEKLCFYVYFNACLLFSWTSILSTFFTVRMFRSVKTYAGVCCFFMSIVSGLSAYFTDWYLIYLFFTVRIFHERKLMFYVYIYACLLYLRTSTLSTFFHSVSFCNSIRRYMYLMFLQIFFYHVYLLFSRIDVLCTFFAVRIIRPITRLTENLCLYVYFYDFLFFFTVKYLVYLFGSKNIALCNSKYMYLMFLYVYCFHLCLLNTQIGTLPTPFFKVYFFQGLLFSWTLSTFLTVRMYR